MSHIRQFSLKLENGQIYNRKMAEENISQVKQSSRCLCEYSKYMFDFSVNANSPTVINDSQRISPKIQAKMMTVFKDSTDACKGSSGPTKDGSILYNKKQKVLNSIRIKESSTGLVRQKHESLSYRPLLQSAIDGKIRNYKLITSNENLAQSSSIRKNTNSIAAAKVMFVPLDDIRHVSFPYGKSIHLHDNAEGHEEIKKIDATTPFDDPFLISTTTDGKFQESNIKDYPNPHNQSTNMLLRALLPPTILCNLKLVSLDEENSSSSDVEEEQETPPETKKPGRSSPKSPMKKGKHQPEPEVKQEQVKPILFKGPRCWVDDVTVSSGISVQEFDATLDQPDFVETKNTALHQISNLKNNAITELKTNNTTNLPTSNKKTLLSLNSFTAELNDELTRSAKEPEDILPSFLCPSSEKKSREVAVKNWIGNTSFNSAAKCVPLL